MMRGFDFAISSLRLMSGMHEEHASPILQEKAAWIGGRYLSRRISAGVPSEPITGWPPDGLRHIAGRVDKGPRRVRLGSAVEKASESPRRYLGSCHEAEQGTKAHE